MSIPDNRWYVEFSIADLKLRYVPNVNDYIESMIKQYGSDLGVKIGLAFRDSWNKEQQSMTNSTKYRLDLFVATPMQITDLERRVRADEIGLFFKKFGQQESLGSTPSDLVAPDYWLNGDPEDYMAYFDKRLEELNK